MLLLDNKVNCIQIQIEDLKVSTSEKIEDLKVSTSEKIDNIHELVVGLEDTCLQRFNTLDGSFQRLNNKIGRLSLNNISKHENSPRMSPLSRTIVGTPSTHSNFSTPSTHSSFSTPLQTPTKKNHRTSEEDDDTEVSKSNNPQVNGILPSGSGNVPRKLNILDGSSSSAFSIVTTGDDSNQSTVHPKIQHQSGNRSLKVSQMNQIPDIDSEKVAPLTSTQDEHVSSSSSADSTGPIVDPSQYKRTKTSPLNDNRIIHHHGPNARLDLRPSSQLSTLSDHRSSDLDVEVNHPASAYNSIVETSTQSDAVNTDKLQKVKQAISTVEDKTETVPPGPEQAMGGSKLQENKEDKQLTESHDLEKPEQKKNLGMSVSERNNVLSTPSDANEETAEPLPQTDLGHMGQGARPNEEADEPLPQTDVTQGARPKHVEPVTFESAEETDLKRETENTQESRDVSEEPESAS